VHHALQCGAAEAYHSSFSSAGWRQISVAYEKLLAASVSAAQKPRETQTSCLAFGSLKMAWPISGGLWRLAHGLAAGLFLSVFH